MPMAPSCRTSRRTHCCVVDAWQGDTRRGQAHLLHRGLILSIHYHYYWPPPSFKDHVQSVTYQRQVCYFVQDLHRPSGVGSSQCYTSKLREGMLQRSVLITALEKKIIFACSHGRSSARSVRAMRVTSPVPDGDLRQSFDQAPLQV